MREKMKFTFLATVKGAEKEIVGYGTSQFEADRDATIKAMREFSAKYDEIDIIKKISEEPTGEWV
jgi:hypothetical protein